MISEKDLDDPDWWQFWKTVLNSKRKDLVRKYYRTRNSIRNGVWPTSYTNIKLVFVIIICILLTEPPVLSPFTEFLHLVGIYLHINNFPLFIRALMLTCVATVSICLTLMYVRRYLLRILLAYRGWMYEAVHRQSRKTFLWGGLVRFVSGYEPSLYSCQRSLPRQPVPNLTETISKLLESLKPICTQSDYENYERMAKDFENGPGRTLQRILIFRSWFVSNYVSEWWEKYVYLMSRSPLPNNSNYYCIDQCYWNPCKNQAARAANILYHVMLFRRDIDREELKPLLIHGTVPICMAQYERIFSTTRIPKENMDELIHYDSKDSKHIVVFCKGRFYKLDVCDEKNQLMSPRNLEQQFNYILNDAVEDGDDVDERFLANLTALDRNDWASIRNTHLCGYEPNKFSLDLIESAILCMTLSDYIPTDLSDKGLFLLNGRASGSHWFDKSLSIVMFADGQAGFNAEHSMADAPVLAHLWEFVISREALHKLYTEDDECMPFPMTFKQAVFAQPKRLSWNITEQLKIHIRRATLLSDKNNDDLDLQIFDHSTWGKGVMKKHRMSPDAFIQMALVLAYYRDSDQKQIPHTYEASMTRLYLNGRTETIRSSTELTAKFVRSMDDDSMANEDKVNLLKRATEVHQKNYRDAMNGLGIDRHLFTLYVLSKALGWDTTFLGAILSMPWTLSTSQQPQQQQKDFQDSNCRHFWDKLSPGGGFGPVCAQGYGVSYMVPRDDAMFFHVTSRKSSAATDSRRFVGNLNKAMEDMKTLLETKTAFKK